MFLSATQQGTIGEQLPATSSNRDSGHHLSFSDLRLSPHLQLSVIRIASSCLGGLFWPQWLLTIWHNPVQTSPLEQAS